LFDTLPISSFTLGMVFQFTIAYGGSYALYANSASIMVTSSTTDFAPVSLML
jgi:hypothetical protein